MHDSMTFKVCKSLPREETSSALHIISLLLYDYFKFLYKTNPWPTNNKPQLQSFMGGLLSGRLPNLGRITGVASRQPTFSMLRKFSHQSATCCRESSWK